ncbi:uncharacterized protein DNG_06424 [Cephalotrichum gorgonifer]|uniref:Ribosomal protein S35, mitochondrial n=1 Tax=Cephalotrichum gorgonifer TaxID=2041049 RepID=A0AAE8MZM4_9PEZI|nr:uncharacterized protein DNG_06424 [Cephalotrichum gorgonifer]
MPPKAATTALRQAARCPSAIVAERRAFSTTRCHNELTQKRTRMFEWLTKLERDMGGKNAGPHYIGGADQPFPQNPFFRSQPVLSEDAREMIWTRVKKNEEPMKVVSADLGIDVRRIAAVVRLKEMEKRWVAEGKKLAKPYSKAIMSMLPQTSYAESGPKPAHEPINDVNVHGYTMQQLFVPTSESRRFTRKDAAKAFHKNMLPAEERSAHPELIEMVKGVLAGESRARSTEKFVNAARASEQALVRQAQEKKKRQDARTVKVNSDRFEFRIESFNSEAVGPAGRARNAPGWKYGAPLDDRKRGKVKIPTSVP